MMMTIPSSEFPNRPPELISGRPGVDSQGHHDVSYMNRHLLDHLCFTKPGVGHGQGRDGSSQIIRRPV